MTDTTMNLGHGKQAKPDLDQSSGFITLILFFGVLLAGLCYTAYSIYADVAGAMTANGSGLQWTTIRNMLMAWVLTLPVAICLSAALYFLFSKLF